MEFLWDFLDVMNTEVRSIYRGSIHATGYVRIKRKFQNPSMKILAQNGKCMHIMVLLGSWG